MGDRWFVSARGSMQEPAEADRAYMSGSGTRTLLAERNSEHTEGFPQRVESIQRSGDALALLMKAHRQFG